MTDEVRDDLAAALLAVDDPRWAEDIEADYHPLDANHEWWEPPRSLADTVLAALPDRSNPVALRAEVERLRAALRAILDHAEADDNYNGEYIDYLVTSPPIDAARALLGDDR